MLGPKFAIDLPNMALPDCPAIVARFRPFNAAVYVLELGGPLKLEVPLHLALAVLILAVLLVFADMRLRLFGREVVLGVHGLKRAAGPVVLKHVGVHNLCRGAFNALNQRHVDRVQIHTGRPVIALDICMGTALRSIEVNLTDRSTFQYPLLIGSEALKRFDALVDPSLKYAAGKPACATDAHTAE